MTATSAGAGVPAADPLIGAEVGGRYRIEERIGEGQMARVYRARHVRLSRSFAVKVLPGARASDPVMRLRFAQEADAASSLDHPNLVAVVDFGRIDSGELYLVMQLVDGESLADLIAREAPLEPRRAIALARALARGLGHAHDRGLVHRDFKPENVVLEEAASGTPLPRILDFGLAIQADPDAGGPRLTEQGFVVGTPIYLAPEQACAEPVDHRADLYALGVTVYEMLAGRPPFDGDAVEVARRKLVESPPRFARLGPAAPVPPALEAVVRRLLEQYPDDRFQSAGELVAALDEVEAHMADAAAPRLPARAEPLMPSAQVPARPTRWRRVAMASTALGLLMVGSALSIDATGAPRASLPAEPPTTAAAPPRLAVPAAPAPALQPAEPTGVAAPPRAAPPPRARRAAAARPDTDEQARLAREYREVGEALDRLRAARGAAVAGPLEAGYLRIAFGDSLRVPALRRETLARLAALRRAIGAAERAP